MSWRSGGVSLELSREELKAKVRIKNSTSVEEKLVIGKNCWSFFSITVQI